MNDVRILLIDDNPQIHEDFRGIFVQKKDEQKRRLGDLFIKIVGQVGSEETRKDFPVRQTRRFVLDSAYQGEDAYGLVKMALAEERPYTIAIVDVRMPPGVDGIQTIKKLWELDPELQVVICTAYSDRSWEEIFFLLNPTDNLLILKKPFDVAEVLQIVHTMSEKWQTSRQLKEANKALEGLVEIQKARMLESYKLAHLGEVASGIAHELNTPLTVIKLRSQQAKRLMNAGTFDVAKIESFLDVIGLTCDRMSKIITDLLNFARDPREDDKGEHELTKILDSTLTLCSEKFRYAGIAIQLDIPSGLMIPCNPVQLSQVFLNLLSNSYDAVYGLSEKWVQVSARKVRDDIIITVVDSGPRISGELAEKIMKPFFTTKPIGKGTGLGLSISLGIIHQHKGRLELDPGAENMTFRISLPAVLS